MHIYHSLVPSHEKRNLNLTFILTAEQKNLNFSVGTRNHDETCTEKKLNTEAKRCFATHDEDIDYFNMRIYIILIACVYIQQFNFVQ